MSDNQPNRPLGPQNPNPPQGYQPGQPQGYQSAPPPFQPQGPNAYGTNPPGSAPQPSKDELKRQAREAKAIYKANQSWFARHKILTALLAVVALFIIAAIGSSLGGDDTETATPAPATQTADEPAPTGEPASTDAPQPTETTAPEPAKPKISNGHHVVGTDLAAGVYRAEVDRGLFELCTVTQKQGENILDLRNAGEGSVIFPVEDLPGSIVEFSGCDNIGLAADMLRTNPATITNGDWLVGSELPAGQYRGTVNLEAVIKLGSITQYGSNGDLIDLANANEGNVVFNVQDLPGSIISFSGLKDIQKIG